MCLVRALIAENLNVDSFDLIAARQLADRAPRSCHAETRDRRAKRCLLDGAGLSGAMVKLAFIKKDDTLRYMLCEPVPGADATCQYVTVKDVQLSSEADRDVFRRVCLDSIAKVEVVYSPAGV